MAKKTIRDLALGGKRVLIRADFNVPLDAQQKITDDRRIVQFLPTLRFALERGARVVLMSHLGRPTGDAAKDAAMSLRPVAARVSELVGRACAFAPACVGPDADAAVAKLADGQLLLLENLRFHAAETIVDSAKKNPDKKLTPEQDRIRESFAAGLSRHGDVYVNDAFGTCHRAHVSMYDVPQRIAAGGRAMGFLVEKELKYLGDALSNPKRPFVAVLGGAKVSDKIGVIRSLLSKVDSVLIGGAMMFTFWAAQNRAVGKSLCERDKLDLARELIAQAGAKLQLPTDAVVAAELRGGAATRVVEGEIPADMMGLDVGPRTLDQFGRVLAQAGTIVWNGPLGAFETQPFDKGTFAVAHKIADATKRGAISIVGGGDSAAAVEEAGMADRFTHISTGGGASLEFLEGKRFKPIDVLDDA
ncbi:MAG: phosphoglycerate kinase [Phycisphaerae bacterium]